MQTAPAPEGEDEVRLDEEMERVVWSDAGAPHAAGCDGDAPRRDSAAPPPYAGEFSPALPVTVSACHLKSCILNAH